MADTDGVKHTTVNLNGVNIHVAEKGEGPVALFVHGFPELWYSWRHQILALSALGYRAVAPDMRGYGGSEAPTGADMYSYMRTVGDLVALIDWLGPEPVFVVGHDWGALVAWQLCLFRPDKVKGLVNLSVAFVPRDPRFSLLEGLRRAYGEDHYTCRFQAPGEIEAEIAENGGVERFLTICLANRNPGPSMLPKGEWFKSTPPRPTWISDEEFAYCIEKFEQTGFTGALNYYRALDLNWELTTPWIGAKVEIPTKFIVGDLDLVYKFPVVQDYINGDEAKRDEMLKEVVVLQGVGHFLQQEKPEEISKHIHEFIKKF